MIYDSRVGFIDLKALSLKDELEREHINKIRAYMKPLMINATDRNVINHDNYQFFFNKLLKLNNIKIQNDVLTKEMVTGKGVKKLSIIGGIICSGLIIIGYIYTDMISRNVGNIAMGASTVLNRVSTLVNVGYGEDLRICNSTPLSSWGTKTKSPFTDLGNNDQGNDYTNSETWVKPNPQSDYTNIRNSFVDAIQEK